MVPIRGYDDGAWLSVNDERRLGSGALWRVEDPEFCGCEPTDLSVESVVDFGVDGRTVAVRAYGTCIACGDDGVTGWLPVGRVRDGEWAPIDRSGLLAPTGAVRQE